MNKNINKSASILIVLIAILNVAYSFLRYSDATEFLGFQVNIWIYRLFWIIVAAGVYYNSFKNKT